MKRLILFTFSILLTFSIAIAQDGINYQGAATDSNGDELTNQNITLRASVLSGGANGNLEWEETHSATTDQFGLFNVVIGQGTNTTNGATATFDDMDWGSTDHYLKIEMDATGGTNYAMIGTTQMMSVPYALYAKSAGIDSTMLANMIGNSGGGMGGGCDFNWPTGVNGQGIIHDLKSGDYTVPIGKNLYITHSVFNSNSAILTVNGFEIILPIESPSWPGNKPLITKEGDIISHIAGSGTPVFVNFYGILIDIDPQINSIVYDITSNNYIVPAGKKLVITNSLYGGSTAILTVNGYEIAYPNESPSWPTLEPLLTNPGDIISWSGGSPSYVHFSGYLADENYFAGCGGGGSSSATSSLDSTTIANMIANSGGGGNVIGNYQSVSHDLDNNSVYWVPTGKNLEITISTQLGSNSNWLYINNKKVHAGSTLMAPLYASQGQSISGYGSINGRLFDNASIDPITWDLNNDGNYIVPANSNLVISQISYGSFGEDIYIDGLFITPEFFTGSSRRAYASENQTISGNGVINGYLIAKDYFTSGLGSSSASAGLDSATVATMIANAMGNSAGSSVPTGIVQAYSGETAPTGWLLCDGSAVSTTTYAELFTLIDTTFGSGDGSTTFNLPDLRGRTIIAADNMGGNSANVVSGADTLGNSGGEETHVLTEDEMPSHSHQTPIESGNQPDMSTYGYKTFGWHSTQPAYSSPSDFPAGGDQPHNNMQPYLIMNYIIKY